MNKHWFVVRTSSGVICYDSDVRTSFGEGHVCTGSCSLYHMDPPVLCLLISSALSVKKKQQLLYRQNRRFIGSLILQTHTKSRSHCKIEEPHPRRQLRLHCLVRSHRRQAGPRRSLPREEKESSGSLSRSKSRIFPQGRRT